MHRQLLKLILLSKQPLISMEHRLNLSLILVLERRFGQLHIEKAYNSQDLGLNLISELRSLVDQQYSILQ